MSGNFSEVIERLHKSLSSINRSDSLSIAAAFETRVAFKIVRIEFSETDAK